jgi:FkbM family methyltransferase
MGAEFEIHKVFSSDKEYSFILNSKVDHVQGVIRSGFFYEFEELNLISSMVDNPKKILDVGANIGNHSIYFAHHFNPDLLVPVEPNRNVLPLLIANLGLNWHPSFDFSLIGCGLSNISGLGDVETKSERNIGGTKLHSCDDGPVRITTGDIAFPKDKFDLIKIDVEGMELLVLEGMKDLLKRSNALVFLEVELANISSAIDDMRKYGYIYDTYYQRYGRCINLVFVKE